MNEQSNSGDASPPANNATAPVRALIGGTLMGLANLVPGVSGGTMLLAAGVYPRFIEAIAEVTKLRLRRAHLVILACVIGAGALAILLLAGPVKDLVVNHRWIMYSLFIGLTLGGVPIIWRMVQPAVPAVWGGALVGLLLMVATVLVSPGGESAAESNWLLLGVAGIAGASAMILPGISGGYILLLLGQYVPILSAISDFKDALLGDAGPDLALAFNIGLSMLPVAIGIVVGVTIISNLVEWALTSHRKATLGFLLGLLVGAVVGLWPFQRSVEPPMGSVVNGAVVSAETIASIEREDWPLERFTPTAGQIAGSVALVLAGFGVTLLIGRLGSEESS